MEFNIHFHFNESTGNENETINYTDTINNILTSFFRNNDINNIINIEELFYETFIGPLEEIIQEEQPKKLVTEEQFNLFMRGYSTKDCSICLEVNNDCVILPCEHTFHEKCIKKWLTEKSSCCPNCKYDCTRIPDIPEDMFDKH